ncbi:hypothetical protein F4775DRAFT_585635 [Biscogniauxia sp. FL1348]|nr:hypothetical protein F4775DRAFT_585635 [Biscogniauxia sp. FL1348]
MSTFCSLCGVLIDMWRGGDQSDRPDPSETLSWLSEVRAIRTTRFIHNPVVTGVGWLNFHGDIIAPCDDSRHYADPELAQDPENYFGRYRLGYASYTYPGYWCYVVHDACWELLRDRIDLGRDVSAGALARHLFALLYNTPADDEGVFAPGHTYGHAAEFQDTSTSHGYFTRVNTSDYSFITGDAREEFQFEDEVLQDAVPSAVGTGALERLVPLGNYSESDVFCLLPNEIIMLILASLPSADVCRLRLASRYVADVSSPSVLSQRFWSSRFDADFEMGFVFAGPFCPRPAEPVDWRMLYLKAKVALRSDLFPGLRNRRRIWRVFQELAATIDLRLANEDYITKSPYTEKSIVVPEGASLSSSACADVSFYPTDPQDIVGITGPARCPLLLSCRLFEKQSLLWPQQHEVDSLKLGVSFVQVDGRRYICGLRYLSPDGMVEYSRAGYVNPREEHHISLGSYDNLECLNVVMAKTGLVGMLLHMKSQENSFSHSVGDIETAQLEGGIGRLSPKEGTACVGFIIGLDACKVISITLVEMPLHIPVVDATDCDWVLDYRNLDQEPVQLWNPSLPEHPHHTSWHYAQFSTQHFDLCLNMDFGGPRGCLLQSLTRINLYMGGFPAVFIGMSFNYEDGTERFYGRKGYRESIGSLAVLRAVQQSFHIDGPMGEIITKFAASYSHVHDTIQSITITTSMGRSQQFRLYGKDSWGDCQEMVAILEPQPGEVFTALYARIKSPIGYFKSISACSMILDKRPSYPDLGYLAIDSHRVPITCKALNSAAEMLAYPRGFAFTAADLTHLSKIRVSVSNEHQPASPAHLSGLQLEFSDSRNPVVLGQWVEELDALNIPPGDRLAEMTTWHDFALTHKKVKFGKIRKLQLRTAGGVGKEFLDPMVRGNICLNYRENPYEELVGLVWGYNHEWDHVRALYGPKPSSGGNLLIESQVGYPSPSWLVRERLFMCEVLKDGTPNPVVGIEVSCKDIGSELSGLTLIYKHGDQWTLGTRGRPLQTMTLSEDEKLVRMDIGVNRGNRIDLISFFTNTGRKVDFSEKSGPTPGQDKNKYHMFIHSRSVFILDPLFTGPSITTNMNELSSSKMRHLREFPEGARRFVGFWAVPKRRDRCLRFNMLGPVFEVAEVEGLNQSKLVEGKLD